MEDEEKDECRQLEVRFATRETADNAYNENNNLVYIRNLPKCYNQSSLEKLFSKYGKILSAKINDNGIAFVRYVIHSYYVYAISQENM